MRLKRENSLLVLRFMPIQQNINSKCFNSQTFFVCNFVILYYFLLVSKENVVKDLPTFLFHLYNANFPPVRICLRQLSAVKSFNHKQSFIRANHFNLNFTDKAIIPCPIFLSPTGVLSKHVICYR